MAQSEARQTGDLEVTGLIPASQQSWVVGSGKGVGYLTSPGRPTDIGFQLGKTCYPCSK